MARRRPIRSPALGTPLAHAGHVSNAAFGAKSEILKELFDTSVVGDAEPVSLAQRPAWRSWQSEADGGRMIELFARANREVAERTADVVGVVAAAAASHAKIGRMWAQAEAARYDDQRRLGERLAGRGLLREGLSAAAGSRPDLDACGPWPVHGPRPSARLARGRL